MNFHFVEIIVMNKPSACPADVNERRVFFEKSWWVIKITGFGALLYPLLRFLDFRAPKKPQYVKVHKAVLPTRGFVVEQGFILFEDEKGPWAISRKCTHLGCRLNFSEKENLLICPCHHSKFTKTGKRVDGPARKNLAIFEVAKMTEAEGIGYIVSL